ncbi:toxin-antitoxin system HicB family antitoxin [Chamaesiphon sp. OTE_8_metabat_110]|nr:toxin-antitoxin system HicB family antitoxin [Chamaesiphon sp. OTE_8_metabat_110]
MILYSGKFLLRMPKSLRRDLVQKAEAEAVSLNQYISSVLSRSVN